jgi:hypothetical protein
VAFSIVGAENATVFVVASQWIPLSSRTIVFVILFFQVKEDSDKVLKLLEVAPRIGGTSCLSRVCGVNLPLLSLYEADRIRVEIQTEQYEVRLDRALVNRFAHNISYRTLYVDFDDTVIVRGRVNTTLIQLLYQARNQDRKLVLLTRHDGCLEARLAEFRLSGLFDQIISVPKGESKARYIADPEAVFIDDSYAERRDVASQKSIPVFSSSMVDLLLDERI